MYNREHGTWESTEQDESVLLWCREPFNRENPEAQFILADQMLSQTSRGKDTADAVYKMEWAAKHDYPLAALAMGQMYHFGWAVHADKERARFWYERAISLGCTEAETWLALLNRPEADKTELIRRVRLISLGAGGFVALLVGIIAVLAVVKLSDRRAEVLVSEDTELITPATVEEFNDALTELIGAYDGTLVVSGIQSTNRLMLQFEGDSLDLSGFPAATVIADGDNYVVVQFETEDEAAECLEALKNMDQILFVCEDEYADYTDETSESQEQFGNTGEITDGQGQSGNLGEITDGQRQSGNTGETTDGQGQSGNTDETTDTQEETSGKTTVRIGKNTELTEFTFSAKSSMAVYVSSHTGFSYYSWGVEFLGLDQLAAWIMTQNTTAVTVAVLDSGVEPCEETESRILSGVDLVEGDGNGQDDGNGHGTHVAGTILDCTQGLDISVLPVRVLNDEGHGSDAAIVQGLKYAIEQGVDVINMSLSSSSCSEAKDYYIQEAIDAGIAVVVSAGNGDAAGNPMDTAGRCPSHLDQCIVVAACDSAGKVASFSNYGESVDVTAPGVGVLSYYIGGTYLSLDGTSMATPHISALAAMLKSYLPEKTPAQIEKYIKQYCIDKENELYYGAGIPWGGYFAGE